MRPRTLLVNPPLWNVYAPHLAVPLLAGVLGQRGWPVTALDLSIESIDWLLSRDGLEEVGGLIEGRLRQGEVDAGLERAALLVERAAERVDGAKATLRSIDGLFALDDFRRAKVDLRNAMWCVSAGFRDLRFDLVVNDGCYDKESTRSVLAAVSDPVDNLYRWLFERHLVPRLADPDLGLVGISASADTQLIAAMTVARLVREHRPDVHVVMGGNFTTRLVTKFRERHPFFDLVDSFVCYEGEDALPLLCQREFEGGVACVPGLAEARAGEVVVAPPADVDLGGLPSADFSDLPLDRYFSPVPVIPTFASRSCAWKCAFCSIPFASNRFRTRKAEAVVDEIEDHRRRYGARHFMFVDEIMTIRSLNEVSRELVERGTDVHWYGETRFAPNLTPALAERIYASGCRRLNLGLESHSQRVLDLMRKGTDVSYIDANVEALLGAGVPIHLFVIFGFPGETPEEAQATSAYVGDVMDRAHRVHGVPYATWGGSAFTLDLHSPVANEPDAFGVRIRPAPADRDLALQLDYDVVHGRRQSTGVGMMSSVYAPGETGGGWVFRWVEKDVEEHLFLRGALDAPVGDAVVSDPVPLPRLDGATELRLAPDVAWRRCARSITGRLPGPCLALYAPSSDALVEFPDLAAPVGRLATGVTRRQLLSALVGGAGLDEEAATAWIRSLVRFRFLVTVAPGGRRLPWPDAQLYEEAGTELCFDDAAETGTVTSTVTGRAVRLNLAGLALWLRCRDGNREATPARLLATYPDASRPAAERLLLTLIDCGLVGLIEADPDPSEPPPGAGGGSDGMTAGAEIAEVVLRPERGLGGCYRRLWWASAVSNLGDGMRLVALPLLAASLTGDVMAVAGVAAALRLPWLLFALASGALADRLDRRRLMMATHGLRLGVELVVGVAVLTGRAGLPLLYSAGFLLGCAETLFDNAAQAMIPAVVAPVDLERANGRLYAAEVITNTFAGPALGGLLFASSSSLPFLLDAVSFGAGAVVLGTIPGSFRAPDPGEVGSRRSLRREIGEGLGWLVRQPSLRALAGLVAALGLLSMVAWSVLVVFALEILDVHGSGYGLLMAAASVGSLGGSLAAPALRARLRLPALLGLSVLVSGVALVGLGATSDPALAAALLGLNGCLVVVWNVVTVSIRQALIPNALLGRVTAIFRLLAWGSMPLGALLGGLLAERLNLRAPFLVAGAGLAVLAVPGMRVGFSLLQGGGATVSSGVIRPGGRTRRG